MTKATLPSTFEPTALRAQAQAELEQALARLPFRAELSFEPLFETLARTVARSDNPHCRQVRPLLQELEGQAALRGAITSPEVVESHRDGIQALMSFVFPELTQDEIPGRAWAPFAPGAFFATPKYREIFGAEDLEITSETTHRGRDYYKENLHAAYWLLYRSLHGDPRTRTEFVKRVRNTTTGLDRFFTLNYNYRFVRVTTPQRDLLPESEFQRLLMMDDIDTLTKRIPLDDVVFSGFCFMTYGEITELHNVSLLKTQLVEPDALTSPEHFERILDRLRSLLQIPDLEAGLALRFRNMTDHKYCTVRSVLKDFDGCLANLEETIYGEVLRSKEPLIIPDLNECACESEIVAHLRARGVRSLCLLPLLEDGEVIGFLELSTPRPEELNSWTRKKLADLVPPLTIAVRRQIDEVVSRVERTIKTHCTAIHPSVEWRFEDAAYRFNQAQDETGSAKFEHIAFDGVYPLYGAMDIRGSSTSRSEAIREDLLEQLAVARASLAHIYTVHPMPIAEYYDAALARYQAGIVVGLSSGDEISVIEFLRTRVEPFFDYIRETVRQDDPSPEADPVAAYYAELDPEMGILYRRRKQYEESVALINDTLSDFLDAAEEKAQAIFPHYFEKYKTDGVEHNIYVGQSMTHGRTFHEVQLKNLRLWQLQVMCEKARIAEALLPRMEVPLRTTPLVLAQSTPLTIQFSAEEKQFAVEGSYNIRYEIIKKRIDKSTIRGTGERLTQPGHLSLIYTHDKERDEYVRYFEFLADKGFLSGEIEHLDLDDLQGVNGLRALRAPIVLTT